MKPASSMKRKYSPVICHEWFRQITRISDTRMRNLKICLLLSVLVSIISSCEKDSSPGFTPKPVIEAYLYEGMPLRDVKISELTGFDKLNEGQIKYLSGLDVKVNIDNTEYTLEESTVNAGYYSLPDGTLLLRPGQVLEFSCTYNSGNVYSQTQVPSRPVNVSISETVKYISPITSIWDLTQLKDISVEVTWSNTDNSYYYVTVKNMESNPESIDPQGYLPDLTASFDIPPLNNDFTTILFNKIKYYGRYRVIVSKVNPEYVVLYQTQNQDSRTLSEPTSNVENGYGIFTAFATDTTYFEVRKP